MNLVFTSGTRLYVSMMKIVITVKGYMFYSICLTGCLNTPPFAFPLHQHMQTTPTYFTLQVLTWYPIHPLYNQQGPSKVIGRGQRKGPLTGDKATELPPQHCVVQLRWLMDCCLRINGQQHAVAGRKSRLEWTNQPSLTLHHAHLKIAHALDKYKQPRVKVTVALTAYIPASAQKKETKGQECTL